MANSSSSRSPISRHKTGSPTMTGTIWLGLWRCWIRAASSRPQGGRAFVQLAAFDGAGLEVVDAGRRAGRYSRRQRKDRAEGKAAHEIAQRRRAGVIAADDAERFRQGALDDGQPVADTVAFGNASAARPVRPDHMHLVAT